MGETVVVLEEDEPEVVLVVATGALGSLAEGFVALTEGFVGAWVSGLAAWGSTPAWWPKKKLLNELAIEDALDGIGLGSRFSDLISSEWRSSPTLDLRLESWAPPWAESEFRRTAALDFSRNSACRLARSFLRFEAIFQTLSEPLVIVASNFKSLNPCDNQIPTSSTTETRPSHGWRGSIRSKITLSVYLSHSWKAQVVLKAWIKLSLKAAMLACADSLLPSVGPVPLLFWQ